MKKIFITILFLVFSNYLFADSGIYQSYIILNNGTATNQYYDAQASTDFPDFHNLNLGSFNIKDSYILKGGELKTWKDNGSDITGAILYYKIYEDGNLVSEFQEINLPWAENNVDGNSNNQKWTTSNSSINILAGLTPGNYNIEIYFKATTSDGDKYSNNSGSNYIASFTILQKKLNISSTVELTEANLDNGELQLTLINETFEDDVLNVSNFNLLNAPIGTTIEEITYTNSTSAILKLAFNQTDFDLDISNFGVEVLALELSGIDNLSKENLTITAIVEDEIVLNEMVTITPSVPKKDEEVTLIFNATGTALESATKVYFHSSVGTDIPDSQAFSNSIGNWGLDDGIGEMIRIGTTNNWKIVLTSIENYYSLNINDDAFALNFLFRDETGSLKEDNAGSNFHLTLNPVNYFLITIPSISPYLVETLQSFSIEAVANSTVDWVLKELDKNGTVINTNLNNIVTTENYSFNHTLSDVDITHYYQLSVDFGSEIKTKNFEVKAYTAITEETRPEGAEKGVNYNFPNTNEVTFVLHTPTSTTYTNYDSSNCTNTSTGTTNSKKVVHLIGDFNNWETSSTYQLKKDGDYWWITINTSALSPVQNEYVFQYLVDGQIRIGDPYSTKISDSDDQYISSSIYPNLAPYPTGKTSGRASVLELNKATYTWQNPSYKRTVSPNNLNIYELHFRDFTEEGTYKAAINKLDYIKDLGINCIHVMPVSEFEGNDSWGYNPNYYFALDKAYGTENDLKEFIDEAHSRGISVVNDLVLNHAFYSNPMAMLYWNADLNQPADDNPWFNPEHKGIYDTSGHWGADWNHASEHTSAMVDDILNYWIEEFKFDGFRFDFTKGFTQSEPDSSDPWASNYNICRIAILERMVSQMWVSHPNTYAIFEHLANDNEDKELADFGILMWSGSGPQTNWAEMAMGTNIESFWSSVYSSRNFNFANYMSYMESHDEERIGYKVKTWGENNDNSTTYLTNRLKLPAAFNMLLPGPRMVWQFGELGYDISIDENGRTGKKPSAWELNYDSDLKRQQIYKLYSEIFKFRNTYNLYHANEDATSIAVIDYGNIGSTTDWVRRMSFSDGVNNGVNNQTQVIVVGNFDTANDNTVVPGYYFTGDWFKYNGDPEIDGTKFTVTSTNDSFDLSKIDPVYILSNSDIIDPQITASTFNINSTSACNYAIAQNDTQYDYSSENWVANSKPSEAHASDNGTISKIYYTQINGNAISNKPTSLSGITLNIGINKINWVVTDSFGNSSSCEQTINITTTGEFPEVSVENHDSITPESTTTINVEEPNMNYTYEWFDSETSISPIGTGNSYTTPNLSESKNYWVRAKENSTLCTSNKLLVQVEVEAKTLSVNNITVSKNNISIYPNPTSCNFSIAISTSKETVEVALFNYQGQLISSKNYDVVNGKINISLQNKPTGLYIAKVNTDAPVTLKIIKQ